MYRALSVTLILMLFAGLAQADDKERHWKVQMDPTLSVAGYANIQLDRAVNNTFSTGVMLWHQDDQSWSSNAYDNETSLGLRVDWFEEGVFERGWHANAMVKFDLRDFSYARSRLKLTQTYQAVFARIYINVGIGVQFVSEIQGIEDSVYDNYESWMLPGWEFSIGRAF